MLNCHIRCISITLLAKTAFIKLLSTGTVKLPHSLSETMNLYLHWYASLIDYICVYF